MNKTTFGIKQKESRFTNSSFWHILHWVPVTVMLLAIVGLSIRMLQGGMTKVLAWSLLPVIPPFLGLIFLIGTTLYAIIRRRLSRTVVITGVVSLLSLVPAPQMLLPVVAYPASISSMTPSATVRLPANVPLKVLEGGDSLAVNFHVGVPDQRWAYDFVVEPYSSGSNELTDYGCYGIPVVAPVAGYVMEAHDGEPDMNPGADLMNIQAPRGNFVALRLEETGTYLIISHLKPGSVLVKVGENVEEGQVIGQCGNSGNTNQPHIHIHHQRQDPTQYPINLAEGLPLFFRDLDGPPMPEGGVRGDTVQHIGK